MYRKTTGFIKVAMVLFLFTVSMFAQQDQQDEKQLKAASLDGAQGLFKTWDAEPLRHGEASFSLGYSHLNRDPGRLVFKTIPASIAVGLFDRLEFFGSVDVHKHVRNWGAGTYRVLPGRLPVPATTLLGVPSFSNQAPFIDVPRSNGRGDTHFGLKINSLSERRGDPLAMSIVGFATIPGHRTSTGLNRGLSAGAYQGGVGYLVSKRAGRFAQIHLNTMLNFIIDPEIGDVELADLQDEFIYRLGAAFPAYGSVQLIAELDGKSYFGRQVPGLNPKKPVDLIVGLRAYAGDRMSVGAGYRASLNHVSENAANRILPAGTNGLVVQLGLGSRRNDPPAVACAAASRSIKQDERTAIRANASDPDGDTLSYTWASSGGRIEGSGDTVTFDATGVAPGQYTITATVSDGRHQASCTAEVAVVKNNLPPAMACEPSSPAITEGESVTLRAVASDPNKDSLTYTWTVDGERLAAAGSSIVFGSEGRKPGAYKVTATASDGELTASCVMTVTIREIPNQPPAIECLSQSIDTVSGGSVELRVRASDPDNDRLTISWSATGGSIKGSNDTATFSAAGLTAGRYTVTATVDDGRGGRASCVMTINVSERIVLIREGEVACGNFASGRARADNCAKAMLDDIAVRMKNNQALRANVIGYTDGSQQERSAKDLGARRARAVADYLIQSGVDGSRLTVTDGGASNPIGDNRTAAGRSRNRRVEIELTVR